ncbi:MAG: NAD-binding protein, partial [Myxococcales bacterium]
FGCANALVTLGCRSALFNIKRNYISMKNSLTLSMTAIARFCIGVLLVTSKPAQWLSEIIDLFPKPIPILVTVVGVGAVRIRSPKGASGEIFSRTEGPRNDFWVRLERSRDRPTRVQRRPPYEAIRISSGNSFVHETESQVILNGSRDINFTMDLVSKDIGIFQSIAERHGVPLEVSPLLVEIFKDGEARYGSREVSPNIIKRLEEAVGVEALAPGFPAEMTDDEPEEPGYEAIPASRS